MNKPFHQEPALLFAAPPIFEELCAVTVHLTDRVISTQLAGMQQPQIIKCREIIFTEPDVIATPSLFVHDTFHVVLTRTYFKTRRLQARFQRIGLEMQKPERVTADVYQACLHYTLLARMAPLWNKVGDWLIQGREFLTHRGYANAVKMELVVNSQELYISVVATSARLPPVDILDLGLNSQQLQQLTQPSYLQQVAFPVSYCWCHVLPSMRKTKIIGVSNGVPESGPFRAYKNFKRHWKNLYGYRLPETEDSMLFFQVSFGPMQGKIFTYPDVCVKASSPQPLARVDPKPILAAFALDLYSRLPAACGQPLRFLPKLRFCNPNLCASSQVSLSSMAPNLSGRPSSSSKAPFRKQADLRQMFARQPPSLPVLPSVAHSTQGKKTCCASNDAANGPFIQKDTVTSSTAPSQNMPGSGVSSPRGCASGSLGQGDVRNASTAGKKVGQRGSSPALSTTRSGARMVSTPSGVLKSFGSGPPIGSHCIPGNNASNKGSTIQTPTDTNVHGAEGGAARISKENLSFNAARGFPDARHNTGVNSPNQSPAPAGSEKTPKIRPIFKTRLQHGGTPRTPGGTLAEGDTPSTPKIVPIFKAKKRRLETPSLKSKISSVSAVSSPFKAVRSCASQSLAKPLGRSPAPPFPGRSPLFGGKSPLFAAPLPTAWPVMKTQAARTTVQQSPGHRVASSPSCSPASQRSLPPTPSLSPSLSTAPPKNAKDKTEVKKPRVKPQVQELDVECLAKNNQLQKANTTTLQAWLKERGVACKSKDKKGDLVARVQVFLNLPVSEQ